MKIAAAAVMLLRMEWPFVAEWVRHLAGQGVDALWLFEDRRPRGYTWNKKPHPQIYWPELEDDEIEARWEAALRQVASAMTIHRRAVRRSEEAEGGPVCLWQRDCLLSAVREVEARGYDWMLHCDGDEFPCSLERGTLRAAVARIPSEIGVACFNQLVFESRWDKANDFSPRRCLDLRRYHQEVVNLKKYLVRPEAAVSLHIHSVELRSPYRALEMRVGDLLSKHYRGIEWALHPGLRAVTSFGGLWED